jgi:hypothetical protein
MTEENYALSSNVFFHGPLPVETAEILIARLGYTAKECVRIRGRLGDLAGNRGWLAECRRGDLKVTDRTDQANRITKR